MPGPAKDAQAWRGIASQQEIIWRAEQMYVTRRIGGVRDACAYRAVTLLTSQRRGVMASMSGQYRIKSGQRRQRQHLKLLQVHLW